MVRSGSPATGPQIRKSNDGMPSSLRSSPNTSHTVPNSNGVTGGQRQHGDGRQAWAQSSWQHLFCNGHFCHWWREVAARIISAMTTAITLLLIVGVIVFLSMITPSSTSFLDHTSTDRDRERFLSELRARPHH